MWPALVNDAIDWLGRGRIASTRSGRRPGSWEACWVARSRRDVSIMPYQEEPRDLPNRFVIEAAPSALAKQFIPIVIAGSVQGRAEAKAAYDRILSSIPALYEQTTAHYEDWIESTLNIATPDARLDTAFRWAKIGIDKGLATNPTARNRAAGGFRTAGDSERPGYAWFFGRDSMWTALATTAEGSFDTTRHALEFLRKFQRADGKIPHEISQSASLIPWFDQFPYPWASADATPLYVIAHADYWRDDGRPRLHRSALGRQSSRRISFRRPPIPMATR